MKVQTIHLPVDLVNPYNRLLAEALTSSGVQCELWTNLPVSRNPRDLLVRLRDSEVVHWHWLQRFYQGRRWWAFLARSGLFASVLCELRIRRIPQVVTVHNMLPHEKSFDWLHRRMARVVGRCADRLIVHSEQVVDAVAAVYGVREKIRVVPHPDYGDPVRTENPAALRTKWALTEFPRWVIAFGGIRRYKAIEKVVESAIPLAARGIGLLVAGWCSDPVYESYLRRLGAGSQIRWEVRRLEGAELSELLLATDAAIMLYAEGLTSGAAHLCLAHGRPLVASNALAFAEINSRGLAVVAEGTEPPTLVDAVQRAIARADDKWRAELKRFRDERSSARVGTALAAVYDEVIFKREKQ